MFDEVLVASIGTGQSHPAYLLSFIADNDSTQIP
jgi:hypothetical protein